MTACTKILRISCVTCCDHSFDDRKTDKQCHCFPANVVKYQHINRSIIIIHSRRLRLRLVKAPCMLALPFPASASFHHEKKQSIWLGESLRTPLKSKCFKCWNRRNQAPFPYFFGPRMEKPDEQLVQRPEGYPLWHVVTIPSMIGKTDKQCHCFPANVVKYQHINRSIIIIHSRRLRLRLVKAPCMLALPFPASASFHHEKKQSIWLGESLRTPLKSKCFKWHEEASSPSPTEGSSPTEG